MELEELEVAERLELLDDPGTPEVLLAEEPERLDDPELFEEAEAPEELEELGIFVARRVRV